ncbi:MAG: plasmid pRiA4b ORF-3 family protein [Aggregatilineales bacterium]
MAKKTPANIYQLKITLHHSKPPIWRRMLVSGDTKLEQLHMIIQIAMGWWNAHLHQFIIDRIYYAADLGEFGLDFEDWGGRKLREDNFVLSDLIKTEKKKFRYEYDFGDSWYHDILVEKILPPDPNQKLPVCIKGKRACPPEDVGGIYSYDFFLEAFKDPNHPAHEDYIQWVGEDFDPEAFDLDAINKTLQEYAKDARLK